MVGRHRESAPNFEEVSIVRTCRLILLFSLAFPVSFIGLYAQTGLFPEIRPETAGFSAERLKRLDDAMQSAVDNKTLAGIVTMVARHGKLVQQRTFGLREIAGSKPMQRDTIFRIYSMTKPITGVAMMILYEEGKWKPSYPIAKHIP
jgi:CubicO group peptidase (beta-lactamase class C family)